MYSGYQKEKAEGNDKPRSIVEVRMKRESAAPADSWRYMY
jgi:hypothetical protein